MRVFLADLGHNQLTFSSDIYPISIANCIAYAREYLKSPSPVEFRMFREPEDLKAALDSSPPAVLGFEAAGLARLAEFAEKDALALATTKAWLRESVLAEMMAHERERLSGFLDGWFSTATQERIRAAVAALQARS